MGREERARMAGEAGRFVVKILHDPKTKKTNVAYTPDDPKLALRLMALGISAVVGNLEEPKAEEVKPLIAPPSAAAVSKFGR